MNCTVVKCAETVLDTLGPGLTETIYQSALAVELRDRGYVVELERIIPVNYKGLGVGFLRADIVVGNEYVIELKTVSKINDAAINQLNAYMRHGSYSKGALLNFNKIVEVKYAASA